MGDQYTFLYSEARPPFCSATFSSNPGQSQDDMVDIAIRMLSSGLHHNLNGRIIIMRYNGGYMEIVADVRKTTKVVERIVEETVEVFDNVL